MANYTLGNLALAERSPQVGGMARRTFVRPELDEPCPDWAYPLIPLSRQQNIDGLGITYERVPLETGQALQDLFPAPPVPKRERKRELVQRRYKPYIKAWAAAVYFALLPYALAKQSSCFSGTGGQAPSDVAVLCIQRLSDLAKKLELSYDRLQKWMAVLILLGFVKRFRNGRQALYVLPMTAYVPSPSPEAVLKKLDVLIESQYVEEMMPDGRIIRRDRCPEWTAQLIEIRTRFALRYQLSTPVLERTQPSDQAFQAMLREISEVIPETVRPDVMRRLLPVLARYHAAVTQHIESTSGNRIVASSRSDAEVRPGETKERAANFSPNLDIAMADRRIVHSAVAPESTFGPPNPHLAGMAVDGQSRFNASCKTQKTGQNSTQSETGENGHRCANVDSMPGESLTLRCNNINSNNSFEVGNNVNVQDAQGQQNAESRKKAELLAELLCVPGNVNFYTKLFNQVSRGELGEDLIKAIFIYTLSRAQAGDISDQGSDALGKYFGGMYKRWSSYRTYNAACQAYSKKWGSTIPKGIRPRDKAIIDPFMQYDFTQIADLIRRGVRADQVAWQQFDGDDVPEQIAVGSSKSTRALEASQSEDLSAEMWANEPPPGSRLAQRSQWRVIETKGPRGWDKLSNANAWENMIRDRYGDRYRYEIVITDHSLWGIYLQDRSNPANELYLFTPDEVQKYLPSKLRLE